MSAAVLQAQAIVRALIKHGVRQVVLAPGSRNAPLSMACLQAADRKLLEVFTRFDERTASFTALGMAKRQLRPVVVITTSGTAAAHLAAAAWEASEAGVPLILMTADRPPTLRDRGANQTILQPEMFGDAVRAEWDLPLAVERNDLYWELAIANSITAAIGDDFTSPGAVHLNLPIAEPLVSSEFNSDWLEGVGMGELITPAAPEPVSLYELFKAENLLQDPVRGVIVVSDPHSGAAALRLGRALEWPVIAEPGSFARSSDVGISRAAEILRDAKNFETLKPDVVITAGRFGLQRSINQLVQQAKLHIAVGRYPLDADPFQSAAHHVLRIPEADVAPANSDWLSAWKQAERDLASTSSEWNETAAIQQLAEQVSSQDLVWFAASNTIRLADAFWPLEHSALQFVNRGTNGIDGLIASASGAALMHSGASYLVIGDVAYLHDMSSLALPNTEAMPNLTIVVLNNHNGKIFSSLEQGSAEFAAVYDRAFGTPHQHDLAKIAEACGWHAINVQNRPEFNAALSVNGAKVLVLDF